MNCMAGFAVPCGVCVECCAESLPSAVPPTFDRALMDEAVRIVHAADPKKCASTTAAEFFGGNDPIPDCGCGPCREYFKLVAAQAARRYAPHPDYVPPAPQPAVPLTYEQKRGLRFEIPTESLLSHVQYDAASIDRVLLAAGARPLIPEELAEPDGVARGGMIARRRNRDRALAEAMQSPPCAVVDDGGESVLQEAQRLTHGPRNNDYGHPFDDYTRTAALISAMLAHKLKEPLVAEEAALIQCCVKLSRHAHAPKRDNMTDLAGYAWVAWACAEERTRRSDSPVSKKEPTAK